MVSNWKYYTFLDSKDELLMKVSQKEHSTRSNYWLIVVILKFLYSEVSINRVNFEFIAVGKQLSSVQSMLATRDCVKNECETMWYIEPTSVRTVYFHNVLKTTISKLYSRHKEFIMLENIAEFIFDLLHLECRSSSSQRQELMSEADAEYRLELRFVQQRTDVRDRILTHLRISGTIADEKPVVFW